MITAQLSVFPSQALPGAVSPRIFGNFLEHLGYAVDGGILAYALANPTFERDPNLNPEQVKALLNAGKLLTRFYLQGRDSQVFPEHWSPGIGATGFGVCALDDARAENIPFPWAALGAAGAASPAVGRIGGALRLRGIAWEQAAKAGDLLSLDDGPAGVRQGILLPFQRCLAYRGHLWLRAAQGAGRLEVGLRRRVRKAGQTSPVGECLALASREVRGSAWQKIEFQFELRPGQVETSEPVDFFIRWLPNPAGDLLIDRAILLPADAIEGAFDPDVLREVRAWGVPLLRWPGGNFVSGYHWRDGSGPLERRPTRPNLAWGGLETNLCGTREFIHFCRLAGCEPHITVNTGTGTPEEAAAWVEFCNGSSDTPMGALRAALGDPQPYQVSLWEVGNETYGAWQQGYHGGEENALRFAEFAAAMRRADPRIELIATGNQFDIAAENPALDHTAADQAWNRAVIESSPRELDYLSLHCLPANDQFLEKLTPEQAYYSLVAQPQSWEQTFMPALQAMLQQTAGKRDPTRPPAALAITEWGVLGTRALAHPRVENYGEVIYAGVFLNMCLRQHNLVPIANATGLLHGGCIRKAAGQVFHDPQFPILQRYTRLSGQQVLRHQLESPTYAAPLAPDLGLPQAAVPYADAAACLDPSSRAVTLALVNRHLAESLQMHITLEPGWRADGASCELLACPNTDGRAKLGEPSPFDWQPSQVSVEDQTIRVVIPPCAVAWVSLPAQE